MPLTFQHPVYPKQHKKGNKLKQKLRLVDIKSGNNSDWQQNKNNVGTFEYISIQFIMFCRIISILLFFERTSNSQTIFRNIYGKYLKQIYANLRNSNAFQIESWFNNFIFTKKVHTHVTHLVLHLQLFKLLVL